MSDAMQVAQQRRTDYKAAIAKKNNEIAELNELIADLDSFIEFGEALLDEKTEKVREVSRPIVATQPASEADDEWHSDDINQGITQVLSQRTG
ncbi:MAG: hypothetical protein ACR2O1_15675 [Boseongicola sp.]